jgi:hypothetical protein
MSEGFEQEGSSGVTVAPERAFVNPFVAGKIGGAAFPGAPAPPRDRSPGTF